MRPLSRQLAVLASSAAATAVGLVLLGFAPWPDPRGTASAGCLALVLAVSLGPLLDPKRSGVGDQAAMRLSFVTNLGALLLFGPVAMMLVATIGALAHALSGSPGTHPIRRSLLDVITAVVASRAAAIAYGLLGGTTAPFTWPWPGVPIAAAVLAYSFIICFATDVVAPIVMRVPIRAWPKQVLRGCPSHFIGAGISVAFVEIIAHRAWAILPVAAVPSYFAWRAYTRHADRLARQQRRLDVAESSDHAVCVVDGAGCVTTWSDALARLLGSPADRALGRSLADAMPLLSQSELPRAIDDALTNRKAQTLPHLGFRSMTGTRMLTVTILPDADGAMLLWRDITEQVQTEEQLKQRAERFSLVAEGANDGLWELDTRTEALYLSARWRAMIGLPRTESHGRSSEWFDRVHADDLIGLRQALSGHGPGDATHVEHEHRIRHEDGSYRRVLCRGVTVRDATGHLRVAGSLTDLTASGIGRDRIRAAEFGDSLTGLGNRAAFVDGLGQRLDAFKQRHGGRFAVLYLDLDRFKAVNDSLGHMVGDELLIGVSRRLETCLRPGDALARLGGDEFAILLNGLGDEMQANAVAFRIQEGLSKPFSIGGRDVVTSASIGIAFSRVDYAHPEEIIRDADTAMYHAKGHGRARHELFDADMQARALDRLELETDLREAIKTNDFEVHYQPIVTLSSRMCTGFEALVRWKRNGKAISPADFIPMAEELGLIDRLGTWVLQEACRAFADWQRRFPACDLDCITVNVSMRQLVQQGFTYLIEQTVHSTGIRPRDLRLEITETALMDAPQLTVQVLQELREVGVKIYLDDFGTGYSSLSHLHKFPVDALKIDRSFVRGLLLEDRPAIVESILALAKTLQTDVVAEGVEDEMQALKLERLGCRRAQGFFFSRPLPAQLVEELLAAGRPLGGQLAERPGIRRIA